MMKKTIPLLKNLSINGLNLQESVNFVLTIIALIVSLTYGIINIGIEASLPAYILLGSSFVLFINLIFISSKNITSHYITNITIGFLTLFILHYYGNNNIGFFWIFLYPLFSVIILGQKKGFIFSLIVLLIIVANITLPLDFFKFNYSIKFVISLLSTYLISWAFTTIYENIRLKEKAELKTDIENSEDEIQIKEVFFSKLSHQIRTPLNNLLMISNMLSETELTEKQNDFVGTILSSTNNLVKTVNEINKISDIDLIERKNENIPFHISSTISNTLKLFRGEEYERLNINLDFKDNISERLIGDPLKLKQIFINLIESFIDLSNSATSDINILIEKKSDLKTEIELFFTVSCHLNEENSGKLYVESGKDKSETDLTIAKKLIENTGNSLHVEDKQHSKTYKFTLQFNKLEPQSPHKDSPGNQKELDKQNEDLNKLHETNLKLEEATVLLVEDNMVNQKIVNLSLKKVVKRIDIANNGKEALDKFGSNKFDIILMDVQMPVMDGITATKKIRELEETTSTHTPIIAITANALSGDREECIEAGMNEYISKPFQIEDLIEKMKKLLGSN